MRSLFIGHGAPTIIHEKTDYTQFLKEYGKTTQKPKAIIIFSAHWEAPIQLIGGVRQYEMIYDFYGFPDDLYQVQYPVKGDYSLTEKIFEAMKSNHIVSQIDTVRGIDHGAWTVLQLMYPEADIPVITMSVNINLPPEKQYEIGASLLELKKEGFLVIGSGGIVHNLRALQYNAGGHVDRWADEFNNWIKEKVTTWDMLALYQYEKIAPNSKMAVPRCEHFIPLLIAMGAGSDNKKATLMQSCFQFGNLSLDFWEFE